MASALDGGWVESGAKEIVVSITVPEDAFLPIRNAEVTSDLIAGMAARIAREKFLAELELVRSQADGLPTN